MKIKTRMGRIGIVATVALATALGGSAAAQAATAYTSISNWSVGQDGAWRTASSSSIDNTFDFTSTCYWGNAGAPTPTYAQMQLQRYNGAFAPISEGNRNVSCSGGASSWGARVKGQQYRYQYNGVAVPGYSGLQNGLFSNAGVTITY